jgi:peroxiredoxin
MTLQIEEKAPLFELYDIDMNLVRLEDFRGSKIVLAFFPGAFTSVCTKEMCTLRDSISNLSKVNGTVIGVAVSDPFSLKAFMEKNNLNFNLLSDYERKVIKLYNIELQDFVGLKGYTVAKRSIFIIDENGYIKYIWITDDPSKEPLYNEVTNVIQNI